jgi:hypothetical protein
VRHAYRNLGDGIAQPHRGDIVAACPCRSPGAQNIFVSNLETWRASGAAENTQLPSTTMPDGYRAMFVRYARRERFRETRGAKRRAFRDFLEPAENVIRPVMLRPAAWRNSRSSRSISRSISCICARSASLRWESLTSCFSFELGMFTTIPYVHAQRGQCKEAPEFLSSINTGLVLGRLPIRAQPSQACERLRFLLRRAQSRHLSLVMPVRLGPSAARSNNSKRFLGPSRTGPSLG